MNTLQNFIAKHKITMSFDYSPTNPYVVDQDSEWAKCANHYKVVLKRPGKRFTSYYSMGCGLSRDPTCQDVLDSLRSESETIEREISFKNWANDLGYNEYSIKALNSWRISQRLSFKFIRFLGPQLYRELLETERL